MRIAVLQDDYPPYHDGGSGIVAFNLAEELRARGHDILVVTAVGDRLQAGTERTRGYDIVRIHTDRDPRLHAYWSLYDPPVVRRVGSLLHSFRPDIVHIHNIHSRLSYGCLLPARRYGRKVLMTAHDTMSISQGKLPDARRGDVVAPIRENVWRQIRERRWSYNPFRTFFVRRLLRRNVDEVIAVSHALQAALRGNSIACNTVIHNGIDVSRWSEPDDVVAFKKKIGTGERTVLFGGRLSAAKGAYALLESFALVAKRIPDAQLLVVGKENITSQRMKDRAKALGIADRLVFTGWMSGDDLRHVYAASAVVAVPSLYLDPFPTVNLEALASRRPVVATKWGGSPEIIEDGVCGSIVDPLDTASFAAAMQHLLEDNALRGQFAKAGYERVANEFSLARQTDRYETLFAASLSMDDSATKRRS